MKKKNIIGIIVIGIVIIGLVIFASVHKYEDSHLRVEGIRVNVEDYALMVDGCSEENAAMCKKQIKVGDKDHELLFQFKDFKENGYPKTLVATIDGHEFYKVAGLNIEVNSTDEYSLFMNFNVINDEVIMFSLTKGVNGGTTTLYAIDVNGNVLLEEQEIDDSNMLIKDYDYNTEFITYKDNQITVLASRLNSSNYYGDEYICDVKSSQVVEATYVYTYQNGKFAKRQTSSVIASKFIKDKEITCQSEN